MSLNEVVEIFNKLVASASCRICGHCYDQPLLSSCGHRMCRNCWKSKKKCPTCGEHVDHTILQDDALMVKVAKAVRNTLHKLQNLHNLEEVNSKLIIGEGWINNMKIQELSASSQNANTLLTSTKKDSTDATSLSRTTHLAHHNFVIKTPKQDDFDKIEWIEESQPCHKKGKENSISLKTGDFPTNNSEDNYVPLRRSSRGKLQEPMTEQQQQATKIVTDATVEKYFDRQFTDTCLSNTKPTIDKSFSKTKNWKSVKKMKREFSKLNKRDVKKLNVSIEMCKRNKSVIKKSNVCLESATSTELPFTIEDNTPQIESDDNDCILAHLPEVVLKTNQKTSDLILGATIEGDLHSYVSAPNSLIPSLNPNTSLKNQSSNFSANTDSTDQKKSVPNSKSGENIVPSSLDLQVTTSYNKISVNTDKCNSKAGASSTKDTNPKKNNAKMPIRPAAKVHPNRQFKKVSKRLPSHRFRPFSRKKVSILNITTPEGSFVITGENICIKKSYVVSANKSIQTESDQLSVQPVQPRKEFVDIGIDTYTLDTEKYNPLEIAPCISKLENRESNIPKPIPDANKTKTNTARVDTATGPFKITESVEKELVNEMECAQEIYMFNECSGVRSEFVSRDIFNSEFVGPGTQKSQTRGNKRLRNELEEPLSKRSKNNNVTLQAMKTQKSTEDYKALGNSDVNLTRELDEITSKAFAQIDADLYEHNEKESENGNDTQKILATPDTELHDNYFGLKTPKSTQNRIINIDSDNSFVDETPQKDNTKHTSIDNTPTTVMKMCNKMPSLTNGKDLTDKVEQIIDDQDVHSPLPLTFFNGITKESTPLRSAPKRSLNFKELEKESESDSFTFQNNSVLEIAKTTLEKELMEKAFERTPKIATLRKQMSLRKEIPREERHIQLACSCLSQSEKMEIIKFAKKQNWEFVESYTPSLTHLIVGVEDRRAQRTVKYIYALAGGKWILSYDWIEACIKNNGLVDEAPYEALDMTGDNGPHLSRTAKKKIFDGMTFYCQPPFNVLERQALEGILETAGGKITRKIEQVSLRNTSEVAIVLAEPQNTLDQQYYCLAIDKSVVPVNYEWAFNCLGSYSLTPLLLLCPSSLIPVKKLNWPRRLFEYDSDELETQ